MAVMIQDTGNFDKLVGKFDIPLLEYWQQVYGDEIKNSMIPTLFTESKSDKFSEAISSLNGAIDFTKWDGEFTFAERKEGDTRTWVPLVWQAGRAYNKFLLDNASVIELQNDQSDFAMGAARTRERCAGGIFTYADQTSFTINGTTLDWTLTSDGLPLANAAHTIPGTGGTQSNLSALELTDDSLETVCQAMFEMKDPDGNEAGMNPDTLMVPTALRKRALEIVGSTGKADTGDNNVNIYDGNLRVIVWDKYRKQAGKTGQPWCVMDSRKAKQSAHWINRLPSGNDYDLHSWKKYETMTWMIGSIMWFSAGMFSPLAYHFSIPA